MYKRQAQTIVKLGNGAADFFQDRVAVLNDCTQCHKNNLQILGGDALQITIGIEIKDHGRFLRQLFRIVGIQCLVQKRAERRVIAAFQRQLVTEFVVRCV